MNIEADIHTLAKWLNEEQTGPIDRQALARVLGHLQHPPAAQRKSLTDEQREKLRDAFAQSLTSVYVCGRVWEAWQYGTMSEGDFQPAGECEDVLDALIEAAHGIKE